MFRVLLKTSISDEASGLADMTFSFDKFGSCSSTKARTDSFIHVPGFGLQHSRDLTKPAIALALF